MSDFIRAEFAAHASRRARRLSLPASAVGLAALVATALLAGCGAPPPLGGPHPADPGGRAPLAAYRSTIAPYESLRPVEPRPWREQNERVAPAPRP